MLFLIITVDTTKIWIKAIVAHKYAEMLQSPLVPQGCGKQLAVIFILKKHQINSWWSISLSKIIRLKVGYIDYCMLKWLIKSFMGFQFDFSVTL